MYDNDPGYVQFALDARQDGLACRARERQVRLRFGYVPRFTFGGSLVRNARFGDLALHFWRNSRAKRSVWRLGVSLFGGSLVRNAHFGDTLIGGIVS